MVDKSPQALGTEHIQWDLTAFYSGPEDGRIQADLEQLLGLMAAFEKDFKGKLTSKLGAALTAYQDIHRWTSKLYGYFELSVAKDSSNTVMRKVASRTGEAISAAQAKHLTFFDLEVARMPKAELDALMADAVVKHHESMLRYTQEMARHYLPEEVEMALTLRSPFGASEFKDMMDEVSTQLRFEMDGKGYTLSEILDVVSDHRDGDVRAKALAVMNEGLVSQKQAYFYARTLNAIAGNLMTDCEARGYSSALEAMNLNNKVDNATVQALHEAVEHVGGEYARRYFKLKARLLGLKTLRWSDRNAPMPFAADKVYTWDEACVIVKKGYGDFSPTLLSLVDEVLDAKNGWVDAPPAATKESGAFDATMVLPDGVKSYMKLNHLGSADDVMTLAHELGHAVHGMLAAEAQGPLMWHAPMPYAETASVFGEMLTFEGLLPLQTDPKEKLALYIDKMGGFFNTVLRQISFSTFEQAFFEKRREGKLSVEDMDALWMDITRRFYGKDGEILSYENMDHLWSYIAHFYHLPFYVYAYAFGELFTQSLMAARSGLGERFEPLYLDLLRAGNTKGAVGLMAPFGLDPQHPDFWTRGMDSSVGVWLSEAEKLADGLGL